MDDYLTAREDLDAEILKKTVTWLDISESADPTYGVRSTTADTETSRSVYAKITVQQWSDRLVKQGFLKAGDALAIFRFEYSEQIDGTVISPAVTVALHDKITYNDEQYIVKEIHPVDDIEGNLICYEARMTKL